MTKKEYYQIRNGCKWTVHRIDWVLVRWLYRQGFSIDIIIMEANKHPLK